MALALFKKLSIQSTRYFGVSPIDINGVYYNTGDEKALVAMVYDHRQHGSIQESTASISK